jgi:dsRNA-specific ribonuclease
MQKINKKTEISENKKKNTSNRQTHKKQFFYK